MVWPLQRAFRGDRAGRRGRVGQGRHPPHRADQVDQVRDVVGADVEDRSGAGQEEEARVRVPVLHAVAHHVRGARGDGADAAVVDELARQLVRAAEEGVGGRPDAQAPGVGDLLQPLALVDGEDEGLLGIDVLARLERHQGDAVVRVGDGEVDHHVDVRVGEELVHRLGAHAELLGARLGGGRVEVGAGAHLEALEERGEPEIGGGDVAAADDADAERAGHGCLLRASAAAASERSAKRLSSLGLSCSIT